MIRPNVIVAVVVAALMAASAASASQQLSYSRAKAAVQAKADKLAGQRTKVKTMFRTGALSYSGSAEWTQTDPTGCKGCGYDPVTGGSYNTPRDESCSVTVKAKLLASGRITTATDSLLCF